VSGSTTPLFLQKSPQAIENKGEGLQKEGKRVQEAAND
jgi:hypothetical protein